ncbi:MAG: hypothetical protein CSA29_01155 [Desulfobacterales bacterium]|nr:MAG: hypothetical protein CSA29_01155 [Desulfobacterales bacterium]
MKKKYLSILTVGLLTLGIAGLANATAISYTATDLADINSGEDLWQYTYSVSDNTFAADTGFTIYFDLGLYDFLDPLTTAPNTDWDVLTWNPDSSLPDDGAYDAYALVDNASLADMFTVSFAWLGGGAGPISQYFEVYDGLTWSVLEDGFTSSGVAAPVPEPATMFLFGTGLVGLVGAGIRKRTKKVTTHPSKKMHKNEKKA